MVLIHDTLTRRKQEIRPANPDGNLRMYECGITPYDEPHIGNARTRIVFDTFRRWLEFRGHRVIHVVNVTDVEDKIIKRAAEAGVTPEELVAKFDAARKELYSKLNFLPPTHEPYATKHIGEIVALIEALIAAGLAYVVDGDAYYSVRGFKDYGKLSGNSLDLLIPGARVAPGEKPRDPLDFALWKAAKPGEPSWSSPWGRGRPGWHIECSAMSMRYLGNSFDIHGGGSDLIFPHHENEIAQSEGATGKPFARIWVHAGFLTLNREKMSKSIGNVLPLRKVLERMPAAALRLLMCQTHYRAPLEWSDDGERQARSSLDTLMRQLEPGAGAPCPDALRKESARRLSAFDEAMDDDLATPRALAELFTLSRACAAAGKPDDVRLGILSRLSALGMELDFGKGELPPDLAPLLAERAAARAARNWGRSDAIRVLFQERGWLIEDTPSGQAVRRA